MNLEEMTFYLTINIISNEVWDGSKKCLLEDEMACKNE